MLSDKFQKVRRDWRYEDDEWYFSVVDFIAIVIDADYTKARKYWNKLKERLSKMEGVGGVFGIREIELVTEIFNNCHQLKMQGKDDKPHPTDAMSIKALNDLLEFIPSKNKKIFLQEFEAVKTELVFPSPIINY